MPSPADELKSMLAVAAKAAVPLYQFLGGPTRSRLRSLLPAPGKASPGAGRTYLFEAGPTTARDAAAAASSGADFAVRCPASLNAAAAVKLAQALQPHAPQWISHPDPMIVRRIS